MPALSLRAWLELVAVLIVVGAVTAWTLHERKVGRSQIELADARASAKLQAATKAETDAMAAAATKAAQEASNAQTALSAYMAAHPIEPVRLCYQNLGGSRMSQTAAAPAGSPAAGTRPAPGGQMSPGGITQSADISSELGTIVRSFGSLAIEVTEFQQLGR